MSKKYRLKQIENNNSEKCLFILFSNSCESINWFLCIKMRFKMKSLFVKKWKLENFFLFHSVILRYYWTSVALNINSNNLLIMRSQHVTIFSTKVWDISLNQVPSGKNLYRFAANFTILIIFSSNAPPLFSVLSIIGERRSFFWHF